MSKKIVDARGMLCPKPLIMTKKALNEISEGQELIVLIDNQTSLQNVERFLNDNGMAVSHAEDHGEYTLTVKKTRDILSRPDAQSYCALPVQGMHAYCFRSDVMGQGDDVLGGILIKACVNTIPDTAPLPKVMVFYNRGIFLTLKDSPLSDTLRELEKKGVKILVCGTCADYFRQKQNIGAGIVSNMYDILDALTGAAKVIYP